VRTVRFRLPRAATAAYHSMVDREGRLWERVGARVEGRRAALEQRAKPSMHPPACNCMQCQQAQRGTGATEVFKC
jgi:hypothetical protein